MLLILIRGRGTGFAMLWLIIGKDLIGNNQPMVWHLANKFIMFFLFLCFIFLWMDGILFYHSQ